METNGKVQLLGADGLPLFRDRQSRLDAEQPGFVMPHVLGFGALLQGSSQTYFREIWDEAMRHSRENALAMRRDEHLQACLRERKRATTSLKWNLESDNPKDPWQKAVCTGIERIIRATPHLRKLMKVLKEDLWYGRYGIQEKWQWKNVQVPVPRAGGISEEQTIPGMHLVDWIPVNGDKIDYKWDGTPTVRLYGGRTEQFPVGDLVIDNLGHSLVLKEKYRERFLISTWEVDDADFFEPERASVVHGLGMRDWLYWSWWTKNEYMTAVVDGLERFGLGFIIINYDASNEQARLEAEKVGKNYSRRSVLLIPKDPATMKSGSGVEVIQTPVAGMEVLLMLQQACEARQERFIIGQSMSSSPKGASAMAGGGPADFERETKWDIVEEDSQCLGETLTGTDREPGLISVIKKWTYPWADFPVRWVFHLDPNEAERKMGTIAQGFNMGMKVPESELQQLSGISAGDPDENMLQNPAFTQLEMQQQQAAMGQAPGAPGGQAPGQAGPEGQPPPEGGGPGGPQGAPGANPLEGMPSGGAGEMEAQSSGDETFDKLMGAGQQGQQEGQEDENAPLTQDDLDDLELLESGNSRPSSLPNQKQYGSTSESVQYGLLGNLGAGIKSAVGSAVNKAKAHGEMLANKPSLGTNLAGMAGHVANDISGKTRGMGEFIRRETDFPGITSPSVSDKRQPTPIAKMREAGTRKAEAEFAQEGAWTPEHRPAEHQDEGPDVVERQESQSPEGHLGNQPSQAEHPQPQVRSNPWLSESIVTAHPDRLPPEMRAGAEKFKPAFTSHLEPHKMFEPVINTMRQLFGGTLDKSEGLGYRAEAMGRHVLVHPIPSLGMVDIGFSHTGFGDFANKHAVRKEVGKDSVTFLKNFRKLIGSIAEAGLNIGYSADERHADFYNKRLPGAGYEKVYESSDKDESGHKDYIWRLKEKSQPVQQHRDDEMVEYGIFGGLKKAVGKIDSAADVAGHAIDEHGLGGAVAKGLGKIFKVGQNALLKPPEAIPIKPYDQALIDNPELAKEVEHKNLTRQAEEHNRRNPSAYPIAKPAPLPVSQPIPAPAAKKQYVPYVPPEPVPPPTNQQSTLAQGSNVSRRQGGTVYPPARQPPVRGPGTNAPAGEIEEALGQVGQKPVPGKTPLPGKPDYPVAQPAGQTRGRIPTAEPISENEPMRGSSRKALFNLIHKYPGREIGEYTDSLKQQGWQEDDIHAATHALARSKRFARHGDEWHPVNPIAQASPVSPGVAQARAASPGAPAVPEMANQATIGSSTSQPLAKTFRPEIQELLDAGKITAQEAESLHEQMSKATGFRKTSPAPAPAPTASAPSGERPTWNKKVFGLPPTGWQEGDPTIELDEPKPSRPTPQPAATAPQAAPTKRQMSDARRKRLDEVLAGPLPDWQKDSIKQTTEYAVKTGKADQIEELSAQRKTAKEIAQELGMDESEVRTIRIGLGVPSQQIGVGGMSGTSQPNPEFEAWLQGRSGKPAAPAAPDLPANPTQQQADEWLQGRLTSPGGRELTEGREPAEATQSTETPAQQGSLKQRLRSILTPPEAAQAPQTPVKPEDILPSPIERNKPEQNLLAPKQIPGEPPLALGNVRMYHGGDPNVQGGRWLTPDKAYAKGYADKSNSPVMFVDVPENHPMLEKAFDDTGATTKAPYKPFEADEALSSQLKPLGEPTAEPAATPTGEGPERVSPEGQPARARQPEETQAGTFTSPAANLASYRGGAPPKPTLEQLDTLIKDTLAQNPRDHFGPKQVAQSVGASIGRPVDARVVGARMRELAGKGDIHPAKGGKWSAQNTKDIPRDPYFKELAEAAALPENGGHHPQDLLNAAEHIKAEHDRDADEHNAVLQDLFNGSFGVMMGAKTLQGMVNEVQKIASQGTDYNALNPKELAGSGPVGSLRRKAGNSAWLTDYVRKAGGFDAVAEEMAARHPGFFADKGASPLQTLWEMLAEKGVMGKMPEHKAWTEAANRLIETKHAETPPPEREPGVESGEYPAPSESPPQGEVPFHGDTAPIQYAEELSPSSGPKWHEHPHFSLGHEHHAKAMAKIPVGGLEHVWGFPVRRHGPDEFHLETDEGPVRASAEHMAHGLKHAWDAHKVYGKEVGQALERASAHNEPDPFEENERHVAEGQAFSNLPHGTPVVSLHPKTYGRLGEIVHEPDQMTGQKRVRVKLEGTPHWESGHVEPLDEKLSWRAKQAAQPEQTETPQPAQGQLFEGSDKVKQSKPFFLAPKVEAKPMTQRETDDFFEVKPEQGNLFSQLSGKAKVPAKESAIPPPEPTAEVGAKPMYTTKRVTGDVKEGPSLGTWMTDDKSVSDYYSGGEHEVKEVQPQFKKPLKIADAHPEFKDMFTTEQVNQALKDAGVKFNFGGDDDKEFWRYVDEGGVKLVNAIKKAGYDALEIPDSLGNKNFRSTLAFPAGGEPEPPPQAASSAEEKKARFKELRSQMEPPPAMAEGYDNMDVSGLIAKRDQLGRDLSQEKSAINEANPQADLRSSVASSNFKTLMIEQIKVELALAKKTGNKAMEKFQAKRLKDMTQRRDTPPPTQGTLFQRLSQAIQYAKDNGEDVDEAIRYARQGANNPAHAGSFAPAGQGVEQPRAEKPMVHEVPKVPAPQPPQLGQGSLSPVAAAKSALQQPQPSSADVQTRKLAPPPAPGQMKGHLKQMLADTPEKEHGPAIADILHSGKFPWHLATPEDHAVMSQHLDSLDPVKFWEVAQSAGHGLHAMGDAPHTEHARDLLHEAARNMPDGPQVPLDAGNKQRAVFLDDSKLNTPGWKKDLQDVLKGLPKVQGQENGYYVPSGFDVKKFLGPNYPVDVKDDFGIGNQPKTNPSASGSVGEPHADLNALAEHDRNRSKVKHLPVPEDVLRNELPTVTKARDSNGGNISTHNAHFPSGHKAKFKSPQEEQEARPGLVPLGEAYKREAAVSDIAEHLGFGDLVPRTIIRDVPGYGVGSMQSWVPGNEDGQDAIAASRTRKPYGTYGDRYSRHDDDVNLSRAALFDYLIGSLDRHQNNWMLHGPEHGKMSLIDNGLSLPRENTWLDSDLFEEAAKRTLNMPNVTKDWTDDKFFDMAKKLKSQGIDDKSLDALRQRWNWIMEAQKAGKFRFGDLHKFYTYNEDEDY